MPYINVENHQHGSNADNAEGNAQHFLPLLLVGAHLLIACRTQQRCRIGARSLTVRCRQAQDRSGRQANSEKSEEFGKDEWPDS